MSYISHSAIVDSGHYYSVPQSYFRSSCLNLLLLGPALAWRILWLMK